MTTLTVPYRENLPRESLRPFRRCWTVEEYEAAWKQGVFKPDERLELVEGEILTKMPQDTPHSAGIGAAQEAVTLAFPTGYWIRIQLPLVLGNMSAPEPDIAVVPGSWRDYRTNQPSTAVLIIEVADSSLAYDRTTKVGLYARAKVPDYWIVNLVDRVLEVHRHPLPMTDTPFGWAYGEVRRYEASESLAPLAVPNSPIAIADLLP